MHRVLALATLLLPALAGCVDEAPLVADDAPAPDDGHVLTANGCWIAGAVGVDFAPAAATPRDVGAPPPFRPADVTEFLGLPATTENVTYGNAHVALACDAWTDGARSAIAPSLGWVGLVVEPPPFAGIETAPLNFLVSTFATVDVTVSSAVGALGVPVIPGVARGGVLRVHGDADDAWRALGAVETGGDGLYESDLLVRPAAGDWSTLRLWFVVPGDDGALHPAALDLEISRGEPLVGSGLFSHSGTSKHPGGRVVVTSGGLAVAGADLDATITVLPDTLDGHWAH